MSQRTVARRYANALYEEADSTGAVEAVDEDVQMLRRSLDSNDELSRFFENPVLSEEKKKKVLQSLLEDRVSPLTLQFLQLLVRKDRETLTKPILDQYQTLRDEQHGIVDAYVRVARALDDETEEALVDALEAQTGKTIRLHVTEEPELIGGVVIRIGDRVFDGSVRNQLSALHERLRKTNLALETDGAAS